ncbi:MAG TPA: hypothetical protein VME24_06185 [Alphaproteobacteria bacterium]|nr:hypothetical protein [Alphaproteobacteria bacterium]
MLTNIVDAAGLTNSFAYQGTNGWITNLATPYGWWKCESPHSYCWKTLTMKANNHQNARSKILELCSEDDYGVWELFGAVTPFFGERKENKSFAKIFTRLVKDLIGEGLIVSKIKSQATAQLEIAALDENELAKQLRNLARPDPESFYWFGLK